MTSKRKPDSEWSKLRSKSTAQRRGLGQLSKDLSALAGNDSDSITGYAVLKEELSAWEKTVREAAAEINKALETLKTKCEEDSETLDERLARGLREAGFEVYGETGLLIANGVVHVEADKRKGIAKVNGVSATALTVESICAQVRTELDRLRASGTPSAEFLTLLLKAYEATLAESAKPFGFQLTTMQLICPVALLKQQPQFRSNPVSANFRDYSRELFRSDLYSLLKSNTTLVGGKRFNFASGSDTAGAIFMLVPQYGRTAHLGRIWFEHTES